MASRPAFADSSAFRTSPRPRTVRLRIEQLEDRCVMSGTPLAALPVPAAIPYWEMKAAWLAVAPKGNPDVVFLGDSILDSFANGPGAAVWEARIAPFGVAELAIGASQTQNVLW